MSEVPEGDYVEQTFPADDLDEDPELPDDAPEADVIEQSIPVPQDDDDYR